MPPGPRCLPGARALVARVLPSLLLAVAVLAQSYPDHVGRVNDFAGVLSAAQRDGLESALAELERDTTAEVAVVTVDGLDGRTVEDYATGLFNAWGIGKRDRDNGVLILLSPSDREVRIEVGYGLEPVVPDGLAGAIIRETFVPAFRDGRLADGLLAGSARVVEIVRRNEVVTAEQRAAYDAAAQQPATSWPMALFLSLFVMIGAFVSGTGVGAKVVPQALFGLVFMGGGLFAGFLAGPPASHPLLLGLGAGVGWMGVRLGRRPSWRASIRGTGKSGAGTGWTMASGGRSSSGRSGGSRSGGFSGGRSGGGGASGRW